MKSILFIGAVNINNPPIGGEEYKNQLFVCRLIEDFDVVIVDTFGWSKRPIVILKLFWNLFFKRFDRIVISASSASTFKLLKVLSGFPSKINKTIYFVIGGYFPEGLRSKVYDVKFYRGLKAIVVEGKKIKQDILSVDRLDNVFVVPNFKIFEIVDKNFHQHFKIGPIKFVFISRICESKGVNTIFQAVRILNSQGFQNLFSVDFFGTIESEFTKSFESEIDLVNCNYKGYLDLMSSPLKGHKLLGEYHVMLFPTHWLGEGFPGVIIDAYAAGLPIIATDWSMNSDIVTNGKSGMLIPINDSEALSDIMLQVITQREQWAKMAESSSKQAAYFHIDAIWPSIRELLLRE